MCSMYWNLKARFTCHNCGSLSEDELQTHWLGHAGSCLNHYVLGERVDELRGIKDAVLDGSNDDFIGHCSACNAWMDFGARIVDETVIEIWPLVDRDADTSLALAH